MNSTDIRSITVEALHGKYNLSVELKPGLNIIYGKNGTGKTTLLHVLANLCDRDIERFRFIRFSNITVKTEAGKQILIQQIHSEDQTTLSVTIDGSIFPPITKDHPSSLELQAALVDIFGGRSVYLPAFRPILEAISQERTQRSSSMVEHRTDEFREIVTREREEGVDRSRNSYDPFFVRDRAQLVAYKTILCREWFGSFVPIVRFPSLWEVSAELMNELRTAELALGAKDRRAFSDVFVEVIKAVLKPESTLTIRPVDKLLDSIRHNLHLLQETQTDVPSVYQEISSMIGEQGHYTTNEENIANRTLQVYEKALTERIEAQENAYKQIENLESSVNRFLSGKRLSVRSTKNYSASITRNREQPKQITLADGKTASLASLSSGERHVLTLLFSATHMSSNDGMLLIDEPELSLHIDWQHIILDELMKQSGDRQIVACTHSPEVIANHREVMIELVPRIIRSTNLQTDSEEDDSELNFID